jgi:hypothetical protein
MWAANPAWREEKERLFAGDFLVAVLAHTRPLFNDFGAEGAFSGEMTFVDFPDSRLNRILENFITGPHAAQRFNGFYRTHITDHFGGFSPHSHRFTRIRKKLKNGRAVLVDVTIGQNGKAFLDAGIERFLFGHDLVVNNLAGGAHGTENRHTLELICAGIIKTAHRGPLGVILFEASPSLNVKGTFIVEAEKKVGRSPPRPSENVTGGTSQSDISFLQWGQIGFSISRMRSSTCCFVSITI